MPDRVTSEVDVNEDLDVVYQAAQPNLAVATAGFPVALEPWKLLLVVVEAALSQPASEQPGGSF